MVFVKDSSKRIFLVLLMFILLLTAFPSRAFAYEQKYLAVLVDPYTHQYVGNILATEKSGGSRPENESTDLSDSRDYVMVNSAFRKEIFNFYDKNKDLIKDYPLTFPGVSPKNGDVLHKQDSEMARKTNSVLLKSLNGAINFIYGKPSTDKELFEKSKSLLLLFDSGSESGGINNSGTIISWERSNTPKGIVYASDKYVTKYLVVTKDGATYSFPYRLSKETTVDEPVNSGEIQGIAWRALIVEAWAHYVRGYLPDNDGEIVELSFMEKTIVGLLNSFVSGVESVLGLDSIEDLVFNFGEKSGDQYLYGALNKEWFDAANVFYVFFTAIAISLFFFAIAQTVFRRNVNVIEGQTNAPIMYDIERLFLAGLILSVAGPIFMELLKFSYLLTGSIASFINEEAASRYLSSIAFSGNGIVSVVAAIAFIVVTCYINVIYIMRNVLLMLYWILSPLFIMSLTMGKRSTKVFTTWVTSLVSTIFIQPLHAIVLVLLFSIPLSSISGIEGLVYICCLVPVSEGLRRIIFNGVGGELVQAARGVSGTASGATFVATQALRKGTKTVAKGVSHSSGTGLIAKGYNKITGHKTEAQKRADFGREKFDFEKEKFEYTKAENFKKEQASIKSGLRADAKQKHAIMETVDQKWSSTHTDGTKMNSCMRESFASLPTDMQQDILSRNPEIITNKGIQQKELGTKSNKEWQGMSSAEKEKYRDEVFRPNIESYMMKPSTKAYEQGSSNMETIKSKSQTKTTVKA